MTLETGERNGSLTVSIQKQGSEAEAKWKEKRKGEEAEAEEQRRMRLKNLTGRNQEKEEVGEEDEKLMALRRQVLSCRGANENDSSCTTVRNGPRTTISGQVSPGSLPTACRQATLKYRASAITGL